MYTYTLDLALNRTLMNQENQRLNLIIQVRFPCGATYLEDPIERLNLLLPLRLPHLHPPLPPHLVPLLPPHAYRVVLIH